MKGYILRQGELQPLQDGDAAHLTSDLNLEGAEDLIVVRHREQVYPVWLVPTRQQDDTWPQDNWSVRLARCRTTADLFEEAQHLTPAQARLFFGTLPESLLEAWTGHPWRQGEVAQQLYRSVSDRFTSSLELAGQQTVELALRPEKVESPLDVPQLLPISTQALAEAGRGVSMAALDLPESVQQALAPLVGGGNLFLHQALALKYLRRARAEQFDVILSTPTASGKTMSFLPGILEDLLKHGGNALFLYPLTALCRDQYGTIEQVCHSLPAGQHLKLARFIGDDRLDERAGLPNLLVATPDKLNNHLLRREIQSFLAGVKYIVLDEAHTYRGAFGTHMSAFLRRLLVTAHSAPILVISSATLKNTVQFAQHLTGRRAFRVVGVSTAPRYPRHLYLASLAKVTKAPERAHSRAIRNLSQTVRDRHSKGLVFVGRRSATRYVAKGLQLRSDPQDLPVVFPFYSGMPEYAERLTHLKSGAGPTVAVSTTTLEAGIDVGALDIVGIVGFPRTRNSFKQMAGRAGRAGTAHVAFLPGSQPPDQYYSQPQNLERLILSESEPVYVNPFNPALLKGHVQRLRYEMQQIGDETGAGLLLRFFPEGLPAEVETALLPLFEEPVQEVQAPPLRGEPGIAHLVVRTGKPGDPHVSVPSVVVGDEAPEWLIERPTPENAAKEWGPESMVVRSDRYYQVQDWKRGQVVERGRTAGAVLIWVVDVTEQVLDPVEVARARRGLQAWPSGALEPHSHDGKAYSQVDVETVVHRRDLGLIRAESGRGQVSTQLQGKRERSVQQVRCTCPRARSRVRLPREAPSHFQVILRGEGGQEQPLGTFQASQWPTWQSGRAQISGDEFRTSFYQVEAREQRQGLLTLLVRRHAFDLELPGECECGATTDVRLVWETSTENVPESWPKHEVFSMTPRAFETDVARVSFAGTSRPALEALGTALVKALPDVMEVDPQEVGVQASSLRGEAQLTFWDTTAGGTGISLDIPNALPRLLRGARDLLALSDQCSCGGQGCFGCIQPFTALDWKHLPYLEDLDQEEAHLMGPATDAALRFLESLLDTLVEEQEAVTAAPVRGEAQFTQVLLELDGGIRGTGGELVAGISEALKVLREHRIEVTVVTSTDRSQAAAYLEEHLPQEAPWLVGSLIAEVKFPQVEKIRHLIPEDRPDRVLWVGSSARGFQAARQMDVTSALTVWQVPARHLSLLPDLLLEAPEHLNAALFQPLDFSWPLEQATRNLRQRHAPLTIHCPDMGSGLDVQVLGRYFSSQAALRHNRLQQASHQVLSFKNTGTLAPLVCETLQAYYPDHLAVFIPSSRPDSALGYGLGLLHDLLLAAGREVRCLHWISPPREKQKAAGSHAARQRNVEGRLSVAGGDLRGRKVLLIDDVVTSGATLSEGRRVLQEAGASVTCFAVAHTMRDLRGEA
ncbi:DEAD/DEAH box helicase [Deinococcus cavernae]|uniref:DEAD/DEAH box helicase n=1 Tax=Deinococcus cavernae TaxID=2320857 RepID=A0A418VHJ4_9DEIO|nr:DEAD/DEAH box helicase [Deinococcus cavernae]RJF75606.1 DEAD/DEAH box helicase [Deinococcus cavernae]